LNKLPQGHSPPKIVQKSVRWLSQVSSCKMIGSILVQMLVPSKHFYFSTVWENLELLFKQLSQFVLSSNSIGPVLGFLARFLEDYVSKQKRERAAAARLDSPPAFGKEHP